MTLIAIKVLSSHVPSSSIWEIQAVPARGGRLQRYGSMVASSMSMTGMSSFTA